MKTQFNTIFPFAYVTGIHSGFVNMYRVKGYYQFGAIKRDRELSEKHADYARQRGNSVIYRIRVRLK